MLFSLLKKRMSPHLRILDLGSFGVVEYSQLRQAKKKGPMIRWAMKICCGDLADVRMILRCLGVIGDILFVGMSILS